MIWLKEQTTWPQREKSVKLSAGIALESEHPLETGALEAVPSQGLHRGQGLGNVGTRDEACHDGVGDREPIIRTQRKRERSSFFRLNKPMATFWLALSWLGRS